jgi:hypothetical protein
MLQPLLLHNYSCLGTYPSQRGLSRWAGWGCTGPSPDNCTTMDLGPGCAADCRAHLIIRLQLTNQAYDGVYDVGTMTVSIELYILVEPRNDGGLIYRRRDRREPTFSTTWSDSIIRSVDTRRWVETARSKGQFDDGDFGAASAFAGHQSHYSQLLRSATAKPALLCHVRLQGQGTDRCGSTQNTRDNQPAIEMHTCFVRCNRYLRNTYPFDAYPHCVSLTTPEV